MPKSSPQYRWATADEWELHQNGGQPIEGAVWVRGHDDESLDLAVPVEEELA